MIPKAERLHNVEEYYFSKKLREVASLVKKGKPIINMAIGSPDLQPPEKVICALETSSKLENAHSYQSYQGIPELRLAMREFYKDKYNVQIQDDEVMPLMGSKEGIMLISLAFLNAGDEVLIPNPGYPTYTSVTKLVGAKPVFYNLDVENNWLPNLEGLENQNLEKVKIMWVNYPHMPTGAKGTAEAFQKIISFAKKHHILVINDNPYSFILNDNPLSIMTVNGAKEFALELNSLSKSFNMAGWRVGLVVGKEKYIKAILQVKSNMDSGMFLGIQKGAIAALKTSKKWFADLNLIYKKRRKIVWEIMEVLNCTYAKNSCGLFVWGKLPNKENAIDFTDKLLKEKHVFIAPGTIFGTNGEGYIRASLCVSEAKLKEVLQRLKVAK
jgi:aspartate/methionine/tyrosine aminotransferase